MKELNEHLLNYTRREFLSKASLGLGGIALASLLNPGSMYGSNLMKDENGLIGTGKAPHFAPKAKRVIICFKVERLHNLNCLIISHY